MWFWELKGNNPLEQGSSFGARLLIEAENYEVVTRKTLCMKRIAFVGLHLLRAAISPNRQPGQVAASKASFPVCIQMYSAGPGLQALP